MQCLPGLSQPEPLSLQWPLLIRASSGDTQTLKGRSGSVCGVWGTQGFVWALWESLEDMGFDSKSDFATPTNFVGASPLPLDVGYLLWWDPTFSCQWSFSRELQFWSSHKRRWVHFDSAILTIHLCRTIISKKLSHCCKHSRAHNRFPNLRIWQREWEPQGNLTLKWSEVAQSCLTICNPMDCSLPSSSIHEILRQGYWLWRPLEFDYRTYTGLGKETLAGHEQNYMCTRTQEKEAVTPQENEPDLPVNVQESLVEAWVYMACRGVRGTEYSSPRSHEVCWKKSFWRRSPLLPLPHSSPEDLPWWLRW